MLLTSIRRRRRCIPGCLPASRCIPGRSCSATSVADRSASDLRNQRVVPDDVVRVDSVRVGDGIDRITRLNRVRKVSRQPSSRRRRSSLRQRRCFRGSGGCLRWRRNRCRLRLVAGEYGRYRGQKNGGPQIPSIRFGDGPRANERCGWGDVHGPTGYGSRKGQNGQRGAAVGPA